MWLQWWHFKLLPQSPGDGQLASNKQWQILIITQSYIVKLYDNIVCVYVEISINRVEANPYKEYNFTGEKEHDCVSLFYLLRISVILEHQ